MRRVTTSAPRFAQSQWACDEPDCPEEYWHDMRSWSNADYAAKRHHERTGHTALVQKQQIRRYG